MSWGRNGKRAARVERVKFQVIYLVCPKCGAEMSYQLGYWRCSATRCQHMVADEPGTEVRRAGK